MSRLGQTAVGYYVPGEWFLGWIRHIANDNGREKTSLICLKTLMRENALCSQVINQLICSFLWRDRPHCCYVTIYPATKFIMTNNIWLGLQIIIYRKCISMCLILKSTSFSSMIKDAEVEISLNTTCS